MVSDCRPGVRSGEGVGAGVIVVLVLAEEASEGKDGIRIDDVGPGGGDVNRADLGTLILGAYSRAVGAESAIVDDAAVPCGGGLRIVGVGGLKPRPCKAQVEVHGVGAVEFVIEAVEGVHLVAVVVEDLVFGAVKETPGIQAVGGNEVSPVLLAIGKIEARVSGAEVAIGCGDFSVGSADAQAGAGGHDDNDAGLVAILGGRRALDHFHRLHGVERYLVGEHFALLVRNWLAIYGERVGGVVAEPVKKAVGIGGDAGRGEGDERTKGGG